MNKFAQMTTDEFKTYQAGFPGEASEELQDRANIINKKIDDQYHSREEIAKALIENGFVENRYPGHKGYSALYEQYGKDERYKEFFSKLKIEGNDIILDHKKFALLTAEHNGKDIFSGDFEKNGQKGISGITYMTGKAGMEQAKKQNKKLFKTGEEADAFINQFPGESTKDKIFAFVNLFGLQKSGFWNPYSKKWGSVGSVGYATLSEVNKNDSVRGVEWRDDGAHIRWPHQKCPQPVVAFEDC